MKQQHHAAEGGISRRHINEAEDEGDKAEDNDVQAALADGGRNRNEAVKEGQDRGMHVESLAEGGRGRNEAVKEGQDGGMHGAIEQERNGVLGSNVGESTGRGYEVERV